jgi:hypothetical protein
VEAFCPYVGGEQVSWIGGESTWPHGTHKRDSAPRLRGYARVPAGLGRGLDGVLSTMTARPEGRPA